jgi:hypothetical protein
MTNGWPSSLVTISFIWCQFYWHLGLHWHLARCMCIAEVVPPGTEVLCHCMSPSLPLLTF